MKTATLALVLIVVSCILLGMAWQSGSLSLPMPSALAGATPASTSSMGNSSVATISPAVQNQKTSSLTLKLEQPPEQLVAQIAQRLQDKYAQTIDNPATQANLLDERNALATEFPQYGYPLFDAAVEIAFPQLAAQIRERIARMAEYREWEAGMHLTLNQLGVLEREGMLWEKRSALFGDAAQQIWADEIQAVQRSQVLVQQELQKLDEASELSLDDTLYQLQSVLATNDATLNLNTFGEAARRSSLSAAFFGLGSVQQQLADLPEDARQSEINRLRQSLGFSASEVQAQAARDQLRNQRWSTGASYMAERNALASQYSGAQLEQQLEQSREQHFGREALTIAREEAEGFYRYERPRIYGRN
ncbi:MAG: hypothetical protein ACK4VV_05825 [Pseudomonas sp.]